jgi:pilus assembly protein CpaB
MRPKSLVLLVLALGCGLIAAIGINQVLASKQQPQTVEEVEKAELVVALSQINPGDPFKPENIKLEAWPKENVPPGAITKIEDLTGRKPRVVIFPGEAIIEPKLMNKDTDGISTRIPAGFRLATVRVDAEKGGAGMILPGDHVDVMVTLQENQSRGIPKTTTLTFLQNVKVVAADNIIDRNTSGETSIAAKTISLLVKPVEVAMVNMAADLGTIKLTLRGHNDDGPADVPAVSPQDLFSGRTPENNQQANTDGAKNLLDILNSQRNEPPAPAPAPPKDHFKMTIMEGGNLKAVEFENGERVDVPVSTPEPAREPIKNTTTDDSTG